MTTIPSGPGSSAIADRNITDTSKKKPVSSGHLPGQVNRLHSINQAVATGEVNKGSKKLTGAKPKLDVRG